MEASDQQISEESRAERPAAIEDDAPEISESENRAATAGASESSNRCDESTLFPPREAKNPIREREISLLQFIPIRDAPENRASVDQPAKRFRPNLTAVGLVAALGCVVCMGAVVGYDRLQYSRLVVARAHESQNLASAVKSLEGRLATIEAMRDKDEATDLRRVLAEIKTSAAATRDFGTTLNQLSSRVDHIEKDQSARFDKLGERVDHDTASRLADVTARLDKLERKLANPVVVSVTPAPPPPAAPPKTTSTQAVSNDTTGSIERPKPRLRGFTVADVRDGYAVVDSRDGPQPVVAGDFIPGAGRVLRIERHGHDWTVVTTQGVITENVAPY